MNRHKRDYCSKGEHPNWKACVAKYDMTTIHWSYLGVFCIYCGARVVGVLGADSPGVAWVRRQRFFRSGEVMYSEYEATQARGRERREKWIKFFCRIRNKLIDNAVLVGSPGGGHSSVRIEKNKQ